MNNINKAIELDPSNSQALMYKGETNSYYGQREEAISSLNEALKYDPHNSEILNALSNIQMNNGDTFGAVINKFRSILGF